MKTRFVPVRPPAVPEQVQERVTEKKSIPRGEEGGGRKVGGLRSPCPFRSRTRSREVAVTSSSRGIQAKIVCVEGVLGIKEVLFVVGSVYVCIPKVCVEAGVCPVYV